jgi:hypothetical protein
MGPRLVKKGTDLFSGDGFIYSAEVDEVASGVLPLPTLNAELNVAEFF